MQPVVTPPIVPSQISAPHVPGLEKSSESEDDRVRRERLERYASPEFTRQLLAHMHEAIKKAILESQEQREQ